MRNVQTYIVPTNQNDKNPIGKGKKPIGNGKKPACNIIPGGAWTAVGATANIGPVVTI
jgi:hypothetical protein